MQEKCPFCDPKVIRAEEFHATQHFRCLYNHKPVLPGHSLMIPKRHVESILELDDDELKEMAMLMKKVSSILMRTYGCTGVDLSLQNGFVAGASIAHLHWHIVPRKAGDIDGDPSLWMAKIIEAERTRQPIPNAEIRENIRRIQHAMDE